MEFWGAKIEDFELREGAEPSQEFKDKIYNKNFTVDTLQERIYGNKIKKEIKEEK